MYGKAQSGISRLEMPSGKGMVAPNPVGNHSHMVMTTGKKMSFPFQGSSVVLRPLLSGEENDWERKHSGK